MPLIALALLSTAVFALIYWVSFFSGSGHITEEKCYLTFEYAFPAADAWAAVAAFLGCIGLLRRKSWGVLFTLLAASGGIFLGLMDLLFDIQYGTFLMSSPDVATEIGLIIWLLTLGPVAIWYVWTRRQALL
jgi:hypothetical protein